MRPRVVTLAVLGTLALAGAAACGLETNRLVDGEQLPDRVTAEAGSGSEKVEVATNPHSPNAIDLHTDSGDITVRSA